MTKHNRLATRGWLFSLLVATFVLAHVSLFHLLWHGNLSRRLIPGALVFLIFLVAAAKHAGLLALLARRFHATFRRQPRP
jgi:galactitol-specific phosphotransferase system IIC component